MPLVIGYASIEDIEILRQHHQTFILDSNESKGLGICPENIDDLLVATYIPISLYDTMDTDKWENTYVIDERDQEEQLKLGL